MEIIELSLLDLRYEKLRLKNVWQEQKLFDSIFHSGIREPIVCSGPGYVVLDGFKRIRILKKLKVYEVPVVMYGEDEASGIMRFLKIGLDKSITTLEQAIFIDELHRIYNLSVTDIAGRLEVSKGWVSVRLGIVEQMSQVAMEKIFSGQFPMRSYMYTMKPFTRVNTPERQKEIDWFIERTSGAGLSTREIDALANHYFRGNGEMKKQIEEGDLHWTARVLIEEDKNKSTGNEATTEITVLKELSRLSYYLTICHGFFSIERSEKQTVLLEKIRPLVCQIINKMELLHKVMEDSYGS